MRRYSIHIKQSFNLIKTDEAFSASRHTPIFFFSNSFYLFIYQVEENIYVLKSLE